MASISSKAVMYTLATSLARLFEELGGVIHYELTDRRIDH